MSDPVTLLVPSEERYRQLAADVARKFMETAGGSADDARALAGDVQASADRLAAAGGPDVQVTLKVTSAGVEIHLRCAGGSATVTRAVATPKS